MLRLRDSRTGSSAVVRPARPGLLRVCAHVPGDSSLTAQRILLVADLVARVAELGNLQAITMLATTGGSAEDMPALKLAADALGIRPPAEQARSGDAESSPGGPADVHVVGSGTDMAGDQSGVVIRVGDAAARRTGQGQEIADVMAAREQDPIAVRFALLSFPVHQAAEITDGELAGSRETIGDWRRRVARWAESPSKPIPAHVSGMIRAALDDLDIPSAIALLRSLAHDDGVPAGAKFETFVYTDRILGLELPRDIGKPV